MLGTSKGSCEMVEYAKSIGVYTIACCLAYCIVALAFLVLRKKRPDMKRPFRVKGGMFVGSLAALMAGVMVLMYIIPGTNCSLIWPEWVIVSGWAFLGTLLAIRAIHLYKDDFCSGMDLD